MARSRLLAAVLLLATAASAQTFRPADGPWTRDHALVGSTPDGRIFARVGQRLGVTADGGASWTVVSETVAPTRLAGNGGTLYGAFPDGVRVSTNGGSSWTRAGLDGQTVLDVAVAETAYAVTRTTVYRLGGGGVWQPLALPPDTPQGFGLNLVGAGGGTVAVAGYVPQCSGVSFRTVFFRSRDAGATWVRTEGSGAASGVAVAPDGTAYFATRDAEGCSNTTSPGALYAQAPAQAAAVVLNSSEAGGVTVDPTGNPVTGPSIPGLNVSGVALSGGAVVIGTRSVSSCNIDPPCSFVSSSGLYASRPGGETPVGFAASEVRALALARVGSAVAVPSDGAIYSLRSADLAFMTPLGGVRALVPVPGASGATLALAAGPREGDGQNPAYSASGLPLAALLGTGSTSYLPLSALATVSAVVAGDRILSVSKGFYSSPAVYVTDAPSLDDTRATTEYSDLGSVGVAGATVYAGSVEGLWQNSQLAPMPARILRSDDRGDTWVPDADGMQARYVYAFAEAGGLHLAGTSGGVFSRTPGAAWRLTGLSGRAVFTFYAAPDGFLAGTDDGLFRRDAAGAWTRYGQGLSGRAAYAVLATTDALGAWIGVGTDAGLFQTRALSVAAETPPEVLAGLRVSTAPNPGRGIRTVRLTGATGRVAVAVFDGLGRRVADLGADATVERAWDASRLPAGVYVVRATAEGGGVATSRAVVVR